MTEINNTPNPSDKSQETKHLKKQPYWRYRQMIRRCYQETHPEYHNYGGRGIEVCQRWLDSYSDYLTDVGSRPSTRHSLDRIDNNGDYEPGNVRWATDKEQSWNSRRTTLIEYNGESKSQREWARYFGIKHSTLCARLSRGWTVEDAFKTPPDFGNKLYETKRLPIINP